MKKINYYEELSKLEDAVINEINDELQRIGRNFDTESGIDFFSFEGPSNEGVSELIFADGMARIKFDNGDDISLQKCLSDATFLFADVISLLNSLREIKPKKKK